MSHTFGSSLEEQDVADDVLSLDISGFLLFDLPMDGNRFYKNKVICPLVKTTLNDQVRAIAPTKLTLK